MGSGASHADAQEERRLQLCTTRDACRLADRGCFPELRPPPQRQKHRDECHMLPCERATLQGRSECFPGSVNACWNNRHRRPNHHVPVWPMRRFGGLQAPINVVNSPCGRVRRAGFGPIVPSGNPHAFLHACMFSRARKSRRPMRPHRGLPLSFSVAETARRVSSCSPPPDRSLHSAARVCRPKLLDPPSLRRNQPCRAHPARFVACGGARPSS